jgi:hypothetical protein
MLKTEQNTQKMEYRVLYAAKRAYPKTKYSRENIFTIFEHGQWWIRFFDITEERDRTFSVQDCEGSYQCYNGFCFEEV